MTSAQVYESLIVEVCDLDRSALIARLTHFEGPLQLDFTDAYLASCSTENIRHLLLAAMWRCRVKGQGN